MTVVIDWVSLKNKPKNNNAVCWLQIKPYFFVITVTWTQ